MQRVKTTVFNGVGKVVRVVEETVGTNIDRGVIMVDGGKYSFTFAPGAWTHIEQEVIDVTAY